MTSKISSFSIAKEDLRHRSWMLALSTLGSILALPVLFLLANRSYLDSYTERGEQRLLLLPSAYCSFITRHSFLSQGIILFAGAAIVAILGFRYLYSKRMVDLYHSLPVKRNRLFFITYINGLLIWLVPMLLSMLLTVIIMFANLASQGLAESFGQILISTLSVLPFYLLAFFTVYHFCLICVMLSGNAINALCTTLISGSVIMVVYFLVVQFCEYFFDTYVGLNMTAQQVAWASPLVSAIVLLSDGASVTSRYGILFANSSINQPVFFYLACLFMIVLMFFAAYYLYLKRPSELAEHGVDNPYFQSFIRISGGFVAAMCGAIVFMAILDTEALGWQLFAIVLCGGFAFGVLDIILHMNFRSFFQHKFQMALTVILSGLFLLIFSWDLTGFDTRLPDKSDIVTASMNLSRFRDSDWNWKFDENGIGRYDSEKEYPMDYRDMDTLYPLLEDLATEEHQISGKYVTSVYVTLTLENGNLFQRRYYLYESDVDALRPIINSDAYRTAWYPVSSGQYPNPDSIRLHSNLNYTESTVTNSQHIEEILNAYYTEFRENYGLDNLMTEIEVGNIYLNYQYTHGDTTATYNMALSLDIYNTYNNTIETIKKYYPELLLDRNDVEITQLQIAADLVEEGIITLDGTLPNQSNQMTADSGKEAAAVITEFTSSSTMPVVVQLEPTPTVSDDGLITINDPDQLQKLLPKLYLGSNSNNPFVDKYEYVGNAVTERGHHINCYIPINELPLDLSDILYVK